MINTNARFFRTGLFVVAMLCMFLIMKKGAIAKTGGANSDTVAKAKTKAAEAYGKLPLSFIQNNGQVDKSVRFYERGAGHATFFTEDGVYLNLVRGLGSGIRGQKKEDGQTKKDKFSAGKKTVKSDIVKLIPLNAKNPSTQIIAETPQAGKVNYLTGNDPAKWKTNIPTYGAVVYKDLYKGIDLKFYGNNRQLEYDIIVNPGADLSQVKLSYEGIQGLKVTEAGDLEIVLKEGSIVQKRPYIYQEIQGRKVEVSGRFKLEREEHRTAHSTTQPFTQSTAPPDYSTSFPYSFEVASYNKDYPLIIDPVLVYSTYLGGDGYDWGDAIAVDSSGNAYAVGGADSTNFPTKDPFQGVYGGGGDDAYLTKINAAGNALVYSTYLGGSGTDGGYGIAVDGSGNAYVTGYTSSTDFPTKNPIQGMYGGGDDDAFVTKLNAAGNALVYSTYLGGTDWEDGQDIEVDGSGNVYVAGATSSTDFPTNNPFQGVLKGDRDVFVTKINAAGNAFVYSTYLGEGNSDCSVGIAVDGSGNVYVAGDTSSPDFPTKNPIQGVYGGGISDAFVTKLNSDGKTLVYSTYLGGSGRDGGHGIEVDASGNAYVTGNTSSTNFPTKNPIQAVYGGGDDDAFVTKLNPAGSALVYSTFLGNSGMDYGREIAVDNSDNAYVTGYTSSTNFPTKNPIQGVYGGSGDAFVTKLNASGTALGYSTYLGGSAYDHGYGIAVDGSGDAYVIGDTTSTTFPTQNAIQGALAGSGAAFVTKIGEGGAGTPPAIGTLTPSALVSAAGIARTFTAVYRDPDGYADIKHAYLRVYTPANGIYLKYDRATNKLYLFNDAGTAPAGSCSPGAKKTLTNTQGILNCGATTVAGSGNDLTIKWNIKPKTAFASATKKNLFMFVRDMSGLKAGWTDKGDWTITP